MSPATPSGPKRIRVKCPECGWKQRLTPTGSPTEATCPRCSHKTPLAWSESVAADREVDSCPVCEGGDFFIHKDLNRNAGLTVVIIVVLISFTLLYLELDWLAYAILFAFAFLDLIIYQMLTFVTVCYRCKTELRGAYQRTAPVFDLHIAEELELEYSRRLEAQAK